MRMHPYRHMVGGIALRGPSRSLGSGFLLLKLAIWLACALLIPLPKQARCEESGQGPIPAYSWVNPLQDISDVVSMTDAAHTYCPFAPDMPSGGGGLCNMEGDKYFGGSAPDILAAARFAHLASASSPEGSKCHTSGRDLGNSCASKVFSTHPFSAWVVADYLFTTQQTTATLQQGRWIEGKAQLDLFLCSDPDCERMADIQSVNCEGRPSSVLGLGFGRIRGTSVGAPLFFLDSGTLRSAEAARPDLILLLPTRFQQNMDITELVYNSSGRIWLLKEPVMLGLGSISRMTHTANGDWSHLRVGKFFVSNFGECVWIIFPKHPWMDKHGWNVSHKCERAPTQVFIFSTYFPQALLNVSTKREDKDGHKFGPPMDNPSWTDASIKKYGEENDSDTLLKYIGSVLFDTVDNLWPGLDGYHSSTWATGCDSCLLRDKAKSDCVVLVIGRAVILAANLTGVAAASRSDPVLQLAEDQGDGNNDQSLVHTVAFMFARITHPLYKRVDPPWCGKPKTPYYFGPWSFTKAFIDLGTPEQPNLVRLDNCSTWKEWGFGSVDVGDHDGPSEPLVSFMEPRWVPLNLSDRWLGFAGDDRLLPESLNADVANIVVVAAGKLWAQTNTVLATTDPTTTWKGGLCLLVIAIVSLMAFNAGKGDLEEFVHKYMFFGYVSLLAHVGVAVAMLLATVTTVVLPSVLAIVAEYGARGAERRERNKCQGVVVTGRPHGIWQVHACWRPYHVV